MAMKDISIQINPDVFFWLRKSSGWTQEDVSHLLGISILKVKEWEKGHDAPRLNQLKKLARAYKRPLAAFLLPRPEIDQPLPSDFRLLPEANSKFTKDCLLKIRESQNLQDKSRELMLNLEMDLNPDIDKFSLDDDTEEIALKERKKMDLSVDKQKSWTDYYQAFNYLRAQIEIKNIFVFQVKADMDDLRGFTLMDSKPFAIVLNNSDAIQARIFTLLHEYAHLLLNEPALCIPQEDITVKNHKAYIEKWCNSFAAAFLLPKSEIITDFNDLGFANYKKIAKRYNASLSSTLTRLYNLNLISHDEYYGEISILQNSTILKDSDESQGYGLNSAKIAKRDKGLTFISLVLENAENDFITNSDVLDYLNIKIKHIEELTNLWV